MVCIYCDGPTQVTNSRLQKRSNQVWRRRLCTVCGNNFTTHEAAELAGSIAVRYSTKELRPFSRDQLFATIYESCRHRPKAIADASALTQTVLDALRGLIQEGTLDRDVIATATHAVLERFDKTAATVYLAYHPLAK